MPDCLASLRQDHDLSTVNTLALESRAANFLRVDQLAEVTAALRLAEARGWPLWVVGGGSNVLLPPRLEGLTLAPGFGGLEFSAPRDGTVLVEVGAGVNWHALVEACVSLDLWGLENLALIPGRAGAAPIQNIGAYGVELGDRLAWVEIIDRRDGERRRLSREACELGYRDSIFKRELNGQVVITRLGLALSTRPMPQLDYGVLRERVQGAPTPRAIFDAVCAIRREKLPDPASLPNAGSFFKNPVVSSARALALQEDYPGMPTYRQADGAVKLAAGWLIEQCGWKGAREGAFGVHAQQALVLVHFGGGTLDQLLAFAGRIAAAVETRFGVALEREPRCLGCDSWR
ncbi:UDP-N-acetylmuramate dehydrogenase [Salinicola avicenniae]|uniref:UDP-N-acetylmuramate dehydrogenase n=1 Tax=Salinicola avicenniae TaxID=2916836 RepID=UPI0020739638|nr:MULTISPECIES: UDP-N-acetylmuramate dehydrogenase [unclassified Salinicola]